VFSAFVQGIGVTELAIVLVIVLIIFGPKRLPQLGRQLGDGMREFRDSITKRHEDDDEAAREQAEAALGRPRDEA
jgi:sec-independent protein translocase protein TatA